MNPEKLQSMIILIMRSIIFLLVSFNRVSFLEPSVEYRN